MSRGLCDAPSKAAVYDANTWRMAQCVVMAPGWGLGLGVQVAMAALLYRTLVEQYAHIILLQPEDLEMAL
jgi:hypothetical protein